MKIKFAFVLLLSSSLLYAMEEQRVSRPMPFLIAEPHSEKQEGKVVILELIDGEKVLYRIQIPYAFAQASSVIWNNLQFQEKEEDQVPTVQFPSSAVTIEQLKVLQGFTHENYLRADVENTINYLADSWYPDSLNKLIDLATIADYIGNKILLGNSINTLYQMFQRLMQEDKGLIIFQLSKGITSSVVQALLEKRIKKNEDINFLIDNLYKFKFEEKFYGGRFHIVQGKKWLCAAINEISIGNRGDKCKVKIIDLETLKPLAMFDIEGQNRSNALKISPTGDHFLWTFVNTHGIYSLHTGEKIASLPFEKIGSTNFSYDGKLIIVAAGDRIYILDAYTLEVKKQLEGEVFSASNSSHKATISADGKFIAFERSKGLISYVIEIWDVEKESLYKEIKVNGTATCLIFSPNSSYFACGFNNNEVKVLNLYDESEPVLVQASDEREDLETESYAYSPQLSFSYDSKLLALGFDNWELRHNERKVKILDYKNNRVEKVYNVWSDNIKALGFSPNGKKLACVRQTSQKPYIPTLFIYDLGLKNLSLPSLILLWYFSEQVNRKQPFIIPSGYSEVFVALPKKIKEYFFERNMEMGQSPSLLPFIYTPDKQSKRSPIKFLKEKRKEREEETRKKKKKKRPFKKFKRAEYLQYNKED